MNKTGKTYDIPIFSIIQTQSVDIMKASNGDEVISNGNQWNENNNPWDVAD